MRQAAELHYNPAAMRLCFVLFCVVCCWWGVPAFAQAPVQATPTVSAAAAGGMMSAAILADAEQLSASPAPTLDTSAQDASCELAEFIPHVIPKAWALMTADRPCERPLGEPDGVPRGRLSRPPQPQR